MGSERQRRIALPLLFLLVPAALAGCAVNLTEPTVSDYPPVLRVDVDPTWSRDDQYIAYRRVLPSQDGPPGIYVVSRWGGKPRFLTPSSFSYPGELRFSPDGRKLVAIQNRYWVVLIDVETGQISPLRYSPDNGLTSPDWSPDGRRIVYGAMFFLSGQPLDSIAIRILDVATGEETPIIHKGQVVYGNETRWSPDGDWILFIQSTTSSMRVMLVRPDGSELRQLAEGTYEDLQWYERVELGLRGAVFRDFARGGAFYSPANRGGVYPWKDYGPWDQYSFDGRELLDSTTSPPDSVALLFIRSVDELAGASMRQVTFYAPPATGSTLVSQYREHRNP